MDINMLESIFVALLGPNISRVAGVVLVCLIVLTVVFKMFFGAWWWEKNKKF